MLTEKEDSPLINSNDRYTYYKMYILYCIAYILAEFADWLQGPFIYALYSEYGYTKHDIGILFVVGFLSSLIIGTFVGPFADLYGRKKSAILYCISYSLCCISMHFNNFWILIFGRVFGGISVSLLYTVFDSWLACEYDLKIPKNSSRRLSISNIFSSGVLGNSISAIFAGIIAQGVSEIHPPERITMTVTIYGHTSPFDIALVILIINGIFISLFWTENYGQSVGQTHSSLYNIYKGCIEIFNSSTLLSIGVVCFTFEASMFIFVFYWTPGLVKVFKKGEFGQEFTSNSLVEDYTNLSLGLIFAFFMAMVMFGSQIYQFFHLVLNVSNKSILKVNLFVAMVSMLSSVFFTLIYTSSFIGLFASFLLYEVTVGVYFPAIFSLKAERTPEESRSTIYSIYRIPLNAIVVSTLLLDVSVSTGFLINTILLAFALSYWMCARCYQM